MKKLTVLFIILLAMIAAGALYLSRSWNPPVETIVASSLKSLHEQNRLSAFAARFVTVVTSSKSRYGLSAEKTLILPAMVRYEVDLGKLAHDDLAWNPVTKTLTITLPPVTLAGPEFDLAATQEYESGAVLLALTDVAKRLDAENRAKATADVLKQAQAEPVMKLARDAAMRAVERSFAMPLAAAGVEAKVITTF